jgi:hypothetical protein
MARWTKTAAGIVGALTASSVAGSARADVCANLTSPSPNLTLINQADDGTKILDHDATRILFASLAGLAIKSRVDGTVTMIAPGNASTFGRLLSDGAIWTDGRWRGGVLSANGATSVYGDWATVPGGVENLATGAVTPVNRPPRFISNSYKSGPTLDVSGTSGTVALGGFIQDVTGVGGGYEIDLVTTSGVDTRLSTGGSGVIPVLDGSNTAYRIHSYEWGEIFVQTASGSELLSPAANFIGPLSLFPQANIDYAVRGGWVAYTKLVGGANLTLEAWTRAPDGTKAKASMNTYVSLAGMSDGGEVVVDRYASNRAFVDRSISKADVAGPTPPLSLGAVRGDMRWVDGAWYEYIGCALFQVGPSAEDPNSGIPPVGGGDAGAEGGADAGGADAGGADASDGGTSSDSSGTASSSGSGSSSGGASSSSSGAASSSSGGASSSGSSGGGGPDGGGGCNVGSTSTENVLALTALAGLALVVARRRRRTS